MTWLSPLAQMSKRSPKRARREVFIEGVRYRSIYEAMEKLGCSSSKVYRLIGEGWRVHCK